DLNSPASISNCCITRSIFIFQIGFFYCCQCPPHRFKLPGRKVRTPGIVCGSERDDTQVYQTPKQPCDVSFNGSDKDTLSQQIRLIGQEQETPGITAQMAVNQLGLHRTANRSHTDERSTCPAAQTVAKEAIFTRDQ